MSVGTSKILIIRHGEKPSKDGAVQGVQSDGSTDPCSLSVRGWQRAGALVRYFCDAGPAGRPNMLFAAALRSSDSSKRSLQTLEPLAELLGIPVRQDFAVGEEIELAAMLTSQEGVVLVAWEHKAIHAIGNALVGDDYTVPQKWPDEQFDVVWEFTPSAAGWSFRSRVQNLLSGDTSGDNVAVSP
jgi:hypothetical protein